MNQTAIDTFSKAGPIAVTIVLGFITLVIFFKLVGWLESRKLHTGVVNIKGVLDGDSHVNVYLKDGTVIQRAKIRQLEIKDYAPSYAFHEMLVLELEQGGFTMLQRENILRIDLPDAKDIAMSIDPEHVREDMLNAD
jgi:hypothetical protein